jgi:beta-phosphoglucomutase-like phosphatase (HAD superfamily)
VCEKCLEIDAKIATYQRIASSITDQPTIDGAKQLVADLQAQKAALHPERKE